MPTHRITLDPGWRITDTVCGIIFVDGVAEVDGLDDHALARLSEMRPQVEAIHADAPMPVAESDAKPFADAPKQSRRKKKYSVADPVGETDSGDQA